MPKSENQKQKILFIMDYLQTHSHKDHPVKTAEIIAMLNEHDIDSDRKTVYSDVKALQEYGLDIVSIPGRNGGFYIASPKDFELPELKLLIDAVLSSRYLTESKSHTLVKKLCRLCGTDKEAELIQRSVIVSGRVKSMNETILINVDTIQDAIAKSKQIRFRYFDWNIKGQRQYREKEYLASPYGLCQDNENCYLLSHTERHGVTSFRVDRMSNIEITDKKRLPCPELTGKALIEQANRRFQMYSGDTVNVKMRFHKDLVNTVFDRFGRDMMIIPEDADHFNITVPVVVSPMFLSWVIGFGKKAKILYPQSVVDQYKALCQDVLSQY
ncbi:MAG: WYL domain-containing transcriptional regulator [Oscillospiraceae bacterium]|nr:WYL domain-containing transcriptional regulator [Oscillospiraceae bacterium]